MKGDPEQRAVQLGEYIVAHHATAHAQRDAAAQAEQSQQQLLLEISMI